jgi:hypothetical protein
LQGDGLHSLGRGNQGNAHSEQSGLGDTISTY